MAKTQVRFQMVSGSFPAGNESAYAARAISGMTESNHGSLKDTLGFLAAAVQRIHGSSDWTASAAGTFAQDVVPDADGSRDLGSASAEWAEVHANALKSATALDIDAVAGVTIDATTVSIDGTDDGNVTITGSAKNLDIAVAGGGDQHLRFASAGTSADALKLNASAGGIDIDANGAIAVDSASTVTLTGAGVLLAGGSSEVDITTSGAFDVNVGSVDLDSSAGVAIDGTAISIDGTDSSNFTMTGNSSSAVTMTIAASNSGSAAGVIDMDADGAITVDAGAGLSLDAAAASNLSTSAGDLTLEAGGSSNKVVIKGDSSSGVAIHLDANEGSSSEIHMEAGVIDMDTSTLTLDASSTINITGAGVDVNAGSGTLELTTSGGIDMNGAAIDIDGSGAMTLDTSDTSNGIKIGVGTSGVPITLGHGTSEVTVADNLTVTGDLTVNGATVQVDVTNMNVADKNILINDGGSTSGSTGAGLDIEGDGASVVGYMRVGSSDNSVFQFKTPGNSGVLTLDIDATKTIGVAGALAIEADSAINQDLTTDSTTAALATLTIATGLVPDASDGAYLGTSSAEWSDLFLADGAVISLGDGGSDTTLTHVADTGILLNSTREIQFGNAAQKISGAASSSGALTLAAGGNIVLSPGSFAHVVPDASDGAQLGTSSVQWSDLFLADGAVINYGGGGQTLTHSTAATLGSDLKGTHGPNLKTSSQSYTTSLSSLGFQSYGSDLSSSHAGNIVGSSITNSASSLEFNSESNAGAFSSAIGSGSPVRFDDGSGMYDISFGSYSSGTTFTITSIVQVKEASSLSVSGLQGSGTIKVISTSGSSATSNASAFNSALPSSRIVRFDDNNGNKIDYTFSSYSSGASIGIASATQVQGSTVGTANISSSSAGGSIKGVTAQTDTLTISDSLTLNGHDGSSLGLTLGSTLVTATGAELNLMDGGTSPSSVTLAGTDGFVINDAGVMKQALISDIATFFATGRSKKSTSIGVSGIAAGAVTTVSGMVHDFGADSDVTDVYLNGQLMLSGSSSSNGDYRINGVGAESSFSSVPSFSNAGLTSSTTSLTFGSAYGGSTVSAGTVLVLENSAGTKRFEGALSADLTNGASSASIVSGGARAFVPSTGVAITGTDFAGSEVNGSSCKLAAALTSDDVVFFFALEGDDVVTITKNG